jgi:hypothetical protein
MKRVRRAVASRTLLAATISTIVSAGWRPGSAVAQEPPVIDSIEITRQDLFTDEQADGNVFLSTLNGLHGVTRPSVIRRELLFAVGDRYDSLIVAESERNLRRRGLFRSTRIDTTTINGKLTVRVSTRDAWSLLPRISPSIASDGRVTGSFGVTETNFIGTGNRVRLWYVRQTDRDGLVTSAAIPWVGSTNWAASGSYSSLSDVRAGTWTAAVPFRSNSDRRSFFFGGEAYTGRVRQYQAFSASVRDTTDYHRRALINRVFYTVAPVARSDEYVRVGLSAEVRREEYLLAPPAPIDRDSAFALVPDSVYAQVSVFAEYRGVRFVRLGRFNGFIEEDQDLSNLVYVSAALAPGSWGYERTGVGGRVVLRSGVRAGPTLLKGSVDANALFNSAGLDSGRVVATGTLAIRTAERHATFLQVSGGAMERPPPGGEFDLGFQIMPRLWGPHAFVGTRSVRATFEHRFFAWDNLGDIIGLGLAGFVDYGGAWYPDQPSRMGGNAGGSLFFGSPLSSLAQISHVSVGYRFGGGIEDSTLKRWGFSLGSGIIF